MVQRHNLASEPAAFVAQPVVTAALARGTEVLPLVLVDGRIAVEGAYPSRETLAALAGVVVKSDKPKRHVSLAQLQSGACCEPDGSSADASGKPGCC